MNTPEPVAAHLLEYRKVLVAADQKGQEEIDKSVLSLSGGGLGVSLVFIKDIIGTNQMVLPGLLMAAWLAWATSTLVILLSFHWSNLSIREGIRQIDRNEAYTAPFGGKYAGWTQRLNGAGIGLFVLGVLCITAFAFVNLPVKERTSGNNNASPTAASTPSAGRPGERLASAAALAASTPAAAAAASIGTRQ